MATNYIAPTWRMPENTNKDKLSNYSLEFNGTDEYIDFPNTNFLNNGQASFSFWIKPKTWPGGANYGYFLSGSSPGGLAYSEGSSSGSYYPGVLYWYTGSTSYLFNVTLSENVWSHIVIVFDGTSVRTYKDGDLGTTTTIVQPSALSFDTIGRYKLNSVHYINGFLSEFSIFDYAVTQEQVTYLYNLNNPMAITGTKPVAYWPLGDNSNPRALAGYPNLSVGGSVFNFIPNDHIELSNDSSLSPTSQLSVSAWVKDTGASAGAFPTIIGNVSTSANKGGWILAKNLNKWKFYLDTTGNSGWAVAESNGTVVVNSWQHLCATWDGSTVIMYLNGQAQTTTASASQIVYLADTTTAIGEYRAGTDYFGGEMSNIALLDTALTPAQVTTLYNNGAPGDISSLSPIAWYKLDSSEIFNSTSTEWSIDNNAYPSVYKSSLNFNGSSSSIDLGTNPFSFTQNLTVSLWIKSTQTATNTFIGKDVNVSGGRNWMVFLYQNKVYFWTTSTGNLSSLKDIQSNVAGLVSDGEWHHIVCVNNQTNGTKQIYIDGILDITNNNGGLISTSSSPVQIGRRSSGSPYSGQMSNVALFDTVLTGPQVETLYNNGTPESSISHSPVSWYKLDNTTTGIQDSAGSNNGTNNGATEYAGFVNTLAGESSGMDSSNLVQSDLYRTTPYSNYSINFDSPSVDYLDFNNASGNIMSNKNAISISGWFKLTSNVNSTVFSCWNGAPVQYLLRYNTASGVQWYLNSNSASTIISTNYFPNVGDWVHVVGVKDPITSGGQSRVYINGTVYTSNNTNLSTPLASISYPDKIGAFNTNNANPMNGNISNVAYWTNTALTQDEVTEIYNAGVTTNLSNFSGTAPDHWCPLDGKKVYYNGSVIVARDAIGTLQATGVNLVQENIVGNAPGSNANGTGSSLDITDLKGDMSNSTKNSHSINMADYGDPNSQGLTPANSGRTTDVPGAVDPGGQFSPFNTSTTPRSFEGDACMDNNDGQFYTEEFPPQPVIPFVGSIVYTDAAGTGYPEEGYYSQFIEEYGMKVYYLIGANGEVTDSDMCI